LDEIFGFRNSVMPEHQLIGEMKNIAIRNIFGFVSFRSGLKSILLQKGELYITLCGRNLIRLIKALG